MAYAGLHSHNIRITVTMKLPNYRMYSSFSHFNFIFFLQHISFCRSSLNILCRPVNKIYVIVWFLNIFDLFAVVWVADLAFVAETMLLYEHSFCLVWWANDYLSLLKRWFPLHKWRIIVKLVTEPLEWNWSVKGICFA